MENYSRIDRAFNKALDILKKRLDFMKTKPGTKKSYLDIQSQIIKDLQEYKNKTEVMISDLQLEIQDISKETVKIIDEKENLQAAFECICLIHGINDFPYFMNMGVEFLHKKSESLYNDGMAKLPNLFEKFFDSLPADEMKAVNDIFNRKFIEYIKQLDLPGGGSKEKIVYQIEKLLQSNQN